MNRVLGLNHAWIYLMWINDTTDLDISVFFCVPQQTLSRFEFGPIRRRVDEGVAFFRQHQLERAELAAKGVIEPKKSPRVCTSVIPLYSLFCFLRRVDNVQLRCCLTACLADNFSLHRHGQAAAAGATR
jgi:hypothetical protein